LCPTRRVGNTKIEREERVQGIRNAGIEPTRRLW
jgi:hypothetical protein